MSTSSESSDLTGHVAIQYQGSPKYRLMMVYGQWWLYVNSAHGEKWYDVEDLIATFEGGIMALNTGEKVPLLNEEWALCAICDKATPKRNMVEQRGHLVCRRCQDITDHENEQS